MRSVLELWRCYIETTKIDLASKLLIASEDKAAKTLKESKAAETFAIVVGAFVVT